MMQKPNRSVSSVKAAIRALYDKEIVLSVDMGRNRVVTCAARLSGVYPALFTVTPERGERMEKTAFSYAEVLCGRVSVRPAK